MIISNLYAVFDSVLWQFGIDNTIDVALQNADYSPTIENPYLAGTMLPALVEQGDLSTTERRNGIYQIDICYPSHTGTIPIAEMADKVNAIFKTGACFTFGDVCLCIESFDNGPIIIVDGWAKMPISVNWQTFTKRL